MLTNDLMITKMIHEQEMQEKFVKDSDPSVIVLEYLNTMPSFLGKLQADYSAAALDRNVGVPQFLKDLEYIRRFTEETMATLTVAPEEDANEKIEGVLKVGKKELSVPDEFDPKFLSNKSPLTVGELEKVNKNIEQISDFIDTIPDAEEDVLSYWENYLERIQKRIEVGLENIERHRNIGLVKEDEERDYPNTKSVGQKLEKGAGFYGPKGRADISGALNTDIDGNKLFIQLDADSESAISKAGKESPKMPNYVFNNGTVYKVTRINDHNSLKKVFIYIEPDKSLNLGKLNRMFSDF